MLQPKIAGWVFTKYQTVKPFFSATPIFSVLTVYWTWCWDYGYIVTEPNSASYELYVESVKCSWAPNFCSIIKILPACIQHEAHDGLLSSSVASITSRIMFVYWACGRSISGEAAAARSLSAQDTACRSVSGWEAAVERTFISCTPSANTLQSAGYSLCVSSWFSSICVTSSCSD